MSKKLSFKGGIFPHRYKERTENLPIEVFPAPSRVIIPLLQHEGKPAQPTVKRGDRVLMGQCIGESDGLNSASVHSSVAGIVHAVNYFPHPVGKQMLAVEIENDGTDEKAPVEVYNKSWREAAPQELINIIASCGIVGMSGTGTPTHLKLSPLSTTPVDTLIINGTECEPFLTSDHRILLEKTEEILIGTLILRKILGAKKTVIAIDDSQKDVINAVHARLSDSHFKEISLGLMRSKYPQGHEKLLITAITGRQVPSGGSSHDAGCVVNSVATALAVRDGIMEGENLYKRVITITGPCVRSPKNLFVRIGTPIRALLEACGYDESITKKIIAGGPMTGLTQSEIDIPVIKTTTGILALDRTTHGTQEYPCIGCSNCAKICPVFLIPSKVAKLVEKYKIDEAEKWHLKDCLECGACAYVCPSKINLVHYMKLGKHLMNVQNNQNTQATVVKAV